MRPISRSHPRGDSRAPYPGISCSDSGFTLIELLVVVAIIGILMAIAIPQFWAYRGRSYDSRTLSDLRNAASAEEAYFADHEKYIDCVGTAVCESSLPGFKASGGVNVSMFQVIAGGSEYFTGRAYHPNGSRNSIATAYMWNSQQGGLQ